MLNGRIFSLRFASHVFMNFFSLMAMWTLLLSLFRLNFYFLSVYHAYPHASIIELIHAFWAGLRFDILVLGFISIPFYLVVVLMGVLMWWPRFMWFFMKSYLFLIWISISVLMLFDFFYFARHGRHLRWEQYQSWDWDLAGGWILALEPTRRWMYIGVWIFISIAGLLALRYLKYKNWKDWVSPQKPGLFEKTRRILVPALLIALAARGTISAHHLRYEDSQVSFVEAINEMALNPMWCLDK